MSNSFGKVFRITTWGESHGKSIGVIVDGCPAQLPLTQQDIQKQLDRRKPNQSEFTTSRKEMDEVVILSGVENGYTLGTPIALMVMNNDQRPSDYKTSASAPRPSHADFTYRAKYGISASSGGGRSSARETIGRVAAGAIAEKILRQFYGIEIVAWVSSIGQIRAASVNPDTIQRSEVDVHPLRCPDLAACQLMSDLVASVQQQKDSIGGTITCVCRGVPAGWGEPVFDKLQALLGHAMLSLPGAKGFEIGSGFTASTMTGSQHNDPFVLKEGRIATQTNHSGGIQGGISNGEPIIMAVALKPPATIGIAQQTIDYAGAPIELMGGGRHDPCVVPRAVAIVEAMAAVVLVDCGLLQEGRQQLQKGGFRGSDPCQSRG